MKKTTNEEEEEEERQAYGVADDAKPRSLYHQIHRRFFQSVYFESGSRTLVFGLSLVRFKVKIRETMDAFLVGSITATGNSG